MRRMGSIPNALPKLKERLQFHSQQQIRQLEKLNKQTTDQFDSLKYENQRLMDQLTHAMKIRENGVSKEKSVELQIQNKETVLL